MIRRLAAGLRALLVLAKAVVASSLPDVQHPSTTIPPLVQGR